MIENKLLSKDHKVFVVLSLGNMKYTRQRTSSL